jgi:hypothetical protein
MVPCRFQLPFLQLLQPWLPVIWNNLNLFRVGIILR